MSWQVLEADCVAAMGEMDEASVDAVVTDPPYGLHFMGKTWDQFGGPTGRDNTTHTERVGAMHAGKYDFSRNQEYQREMTSWAAACLRVLKPGGHLLAFGGTRTYHRLACAVEDAGFEIRDSVIWLYGSGFPKSLDVSKAIDKAAGAEREVLGVNPNGRHGEPLAFGGQNARPNLVGKDADLTAPATPEAQRWQGWGTALKPAHEPIVVARKPLVGTVAQNVERFGTGALNIDATRIGNGEPVQSQVAHRTGNFTTPLDHDGERPREYSTEGRWPANVALSHLPECEEEGCAESCAVAELDRQTEGRLAITGVYRNNPDVPVGARGGSGINTVYGQYDQSRRSESHLDNRYANERGGASRFFTTFHDQEESWSSTSTPSPMKGTGLLPSEQDAGRTPPSTTSSPPTREPESSASIPPTRLNDGDEPRFRYCAKASRAERNAGLEGFEERETRGNYGDGIQDARPHTPEGYEYRATTRNSHPTVKPVELMRWLCRLVTPPDGTVLDPFAGSGTTGIACVLEDFDFIGIDREADYVEIAKARIDYWAKQPKQLDLLDAV